MSKRSIAVPVDTNPRRAKASAAPPDPDPDTRMADADADADADDDDADADAKSSPQAASSNEEESKTYQMLVKEIFLQQWSQDDDKDLEAYLTLIGNAEEYPDALCDAAVAAFQGKRDMISQQAKISKRTVSDLAKASLQFFKHQPERFRVVNEMHLSFFLGSLCTDVLREYYKKTKEQDQSQTVSSESKDRMVPVNYFISDTALSHKYDVEKFVLQAERVSEWFTTAGDDSIVASEYEDAPYFCVVQSSGMGKTKIMYEGCKVLREKNKWYCFTVLPSTLNDANDMANGDVFSRQLLNLEACAKAQTALDAADAALEYLNTFCDKLVGLANQEDGNDTIIFLCFDEAQVYLESQSFKDGDKNVEHAAFLFRCIRLWLRQKRADGRRVIGCFSGTIATLASFRMENDPQLPVLSSRDFTPSKYDLYHKGNKVFPIFLQTTTMGCLSGRNIEGDKKKTKDTTEYRRAMRQGRPLFEIMEEDGVLTKNEGSVVRRMLLYGLRNDWIAGKESLKACLSILGTRVQMGQTSFPIASDMVGYGYANLTHATSTDAIICYMPDPVCGRLAMKLMDAKWELGDIQGRETSWWLRKMKDIFAQGLCRPEKGDFGEVMVALYFLVCADVLRQQNDKTFSVSLGGWIKKLTTGGLEKRTEHPSDDALPKRKSKRLLAKRQISKTTEKADETMKEADKVQVKATVSFIQVCRNYLRSYEADWVGFCSQKFLSQIYESGTAFYVFPGCPIIDLVIPIKLSLEQGAKAYFAPMVISIKSHAYYSPGDARGECQRMIERFKAVEHDVEKEEFEFFPGALCLLVVFGSTAVSNDNDLTLNDSAINELAEKKIVGRVLRIPANDAFGGFCDTFRTLTSELTFGSSEVFASHTFVRAYCKDGETEELHSGAALRSSPGKEEAELLLNLHEQFKDGYSKS